MSGYQLMLLFVFRKVSDMERALQWLLVLFIISNDALGDSRLVSSGNNELAGRKLSNIDFSDVISIDCGVNVKYTDPATSIQYQADDTVFIQSGQICNVSSEYLFDSVTQIGKQLNSLRSFPDGKRNCYTLKPKQGKNRQYFIRAYFAYGNYDNKDKVPYFHLHLGVNFWSEVDLDDDVENVLRIEVIHFTSTGIIDVCLVNIDQGVPFISLLELWPLDGSIYQASFTFLPLNLKTRSNLGMPEKDAIFLRYMDDIYGRSWFNRKMKNSSLISTTAEIDFDKLENPYKLPKEVLKTAVKALSLSSSLDILTGFGMSYEYYVYLHFFDFEERTDNQIRIMEITINDQTQSLTLSDWKPTTIFQSIDKGKGVYHISIKSSSYSDLPALLNAYEIYSILPQLNSTTQQEDVDAIRDIKDKYKIPIINWQGDPCGPISFTWEGLNCSGGDNPRIISLDLSSRKMAGDIVASFSSLTNLEILDLSNNELTGEVPKFFADLPKLKILNLSRNKLTGSIPDALKAKLNNPLQLSLDGNPGLNQTQVDPVKSHTQKSIVPLAASIAAASVAVLIIVVIVSVMVWRRKRKNGSVTSPGYKNDRQLKSKNQAFPYSDVLSITQGFKTVIGEGGFGKVYLGILQDGRRVAVKLLSSLSRQGYKEFQSEANLLMIVHHRNLVSLVGYCDEGDIKALIYEYTSNGNLQQRLSDENPNILTWRERLQIALDAAYGLDYLHNGCKPPIIHRDLKPSNILLNENMQAKISDFGLSRAFASDIDFYVSTRPAGTPGYLDPEFHSSGNLSKKSDVYSFGVVLLELITGQPALRKTSGNINHILHWVNVELQTGDIHAIVDPRLQRKYNIASAWRLIEIAMSCIPEVAIQRPDISHIVSELKECLSLEISLERTESNKRKSSNSLDMGSLMIESDIGPYPR